MLSLSQFAIDPDPERRSRRSLLSPRRLCRLVDRDPSCRRTVHYRAKGRGLIRHAAVESGDADGIRIARCRCVSNTCVLYGLEVPLRFFYTL